MSDVVTVAAWDDVATETPLPGIQRQTIHGERQTLVRYRYAPGSIFPVHSHPEEQITVVLSGEIRFEIGGRAVTLGPGQIATIPGGVPHGATVLGTEPVESLNAVSPRRAASPALSDRVAP